MLIIGGLRITQQMMFLNQGYKGEMEVPQHE